MTCGSCAQRVERALLEREDVTDAEVNLMGAKVRVTYDHETNPSSLFDDVKDIGYEMAPLTSEGGGPVSEGLFGEERPGASARHLRGFGLLCRPFDGRLHAGPP